MSSRTSSEFGSLGDRVAAMASASQQEPAVAGGEVGESGAPAMATGPDVVVDGQGERREVETCHVWVDGVHAGILTSWWRPIDVWLGEIAWTPPDQPGAVVLDWVEASRLRRQG